MMRNALAFVRYVRPQVVNCTMCRVVDDCHLIPDRFNESGASGDQEPFVEDIETYAQDIVDTVREPLLMLDTNLRVQSANRAFYETFQVSPAETEDQPIYQLGK